MAQIVDYHDKDVEFTQGPFLIVTNVDTNCCRIEVEHKGVTWPVRPQPSISFWIQKNHNLIPGTFPDTPSCRERLVNIVNHLNHEVKKGNIVLDGNVWVTRKK